MNKILHILTKPLDETDQILMAAWEGRGENQRFDLTHFDSAGEAPDYDRLVDLIFDADITVTW